MINYTKLLCQLERSNLQIHPTVRFILKNHETMITETLEYRR